jgi:hypothetical protein
LASPAEEGAMLLKRFAPQSTRLLADRLSVTVKGYLRAGDAVGADPKVAAAKSPKDLTVDMFSGATKH